MIEFLRSVFQRHCDDDAIVWKGQVFRYGWLLQHIDAWRDELRARAIPAGAVVAVEGDFSPQSVALFLALCAHRCILVPLTTSVEAKKDEFMQVAEVEYTFRIDRHDQATFLPWERRADHAHYRTLRQRCHPGLVLFSSGSTGKSKAAVHDMTALLDKFKVPRKRMRVVTFLLYDHIGGINTLLYTLSNGGCVVTVPARTPDEVLAAVEQFRVELLPVSPTFVNLLLASEAFSRHDVSSLHTITYGTEPMPETTLRRLHQVLPQANLQQTYGLSETGILRSKSKAADSLWVKLGGEDFQTRVVDGILHIRAKSAMLGYLNAPSPFTDDGWFVTGDAVEVDGEYFKILGRKSEIINVGGEKVYPAEVEDLIQTLENVAEVTVYGERHALMGQIVCARVRLEKEEPAAAFIPRLKLFCRSRLQSYKVPVKVVLDDRVQHGERFKKLRAEL